MDGRFSESGQDVGQILARQYSCSRAVSDQMMRTFSFATATQALAVASRCCLSMIQKLRLSVLTLARKTTETCTMNQQRSQVWVSASSSTSRQARRTWRCSLTMLPPVIIQHLALNPRPAQSARRLSPLVSNLRTNSSPLGTASSSAHRHPRSVSLMSPTKHASTPQKQVRCSEGYAWEPRKMDMPPKTAGWEVQSNQLPLQFDGPCDQVGKTTISSVYYRSGIRVPDICLGFG